ncbi:MAG: hypothetical protein ACJ8EB_00250 [Allosphingosinicella sp.]
MAVIPISGNNGMNRYAVKIGNDFEIEAASISDLSSLPPIVAEASRYRSATRRDRLAIVVISLMSATLIGAALLGVTHDSYTELHGVWDALAVPFAAVLTFYFSRGE